jgi:hypothetical protein
VAIIEPLYLSLLAGADRGETVGIDCHRIERG